MRIDIATVWAAPTAWVDTSNCFSLQVYNKELNNWFEIGKFGNMYYTKMVLDSLVKQHPFNLIGVWAMTKGEAELLFMKGPHTDDFVRKDNEMKGNK